MSELIGNDPHLMAECGGQQPLDNDSSSDGQPSDNTAGNDNHEHSEETQPHHYHIVPQHSDGDVILECKDRVSFLVSSAVLRVSSRYFRTLFDGNFKEAQIPRSTTNPPRIPLDEKDSDALRRLFCLLHHQRDPDAVQYLIHLAEEKNAHIITAAARRLQDLAAVIDYYECSEPLGRVIDSLLKDFATPSMRGKMTFAATVHVTSAAYMMENAQYFRLFTKRLVTDYSEPLEDADSAETMPERADIIFELDKQSRQMWHRLATEVGQLCKCPCPSASPICITGGKDRLFVEKLKDCLLPPGIAWPTERGEGITLRHLLVDLYGLEDGIAGRLTSQMVFAWLARKGLTAQPLPLTATVRTPKNNKRKCGFAAILTGLALALQKASNVGQSQGVGGRGGTIFVSGQVGTCRLMANEKKGFVDMGGICKLNHRSTESEIM